MKINKLLGIPLFAGMCLLCQVIAFQTPHQAHFHVPDHTSPLERETLVLKSIYHHASANGPIPKLFRRHDVPAEIMALDTQPKYLLHPVLDQVDRPSEFMVQNLRMLHDRGQFMRWRTLSGIRRYGFDMETDWGLLPNVSDRESVLALAMMTNNAYSETNETDWYDIGAPWQVNASFGWESDGIRGHVFSNEDHTLMVISIKGTSAGLWTGGPTGVKDKINDNMLFSCCCARISRAWTPVCDCYQGNEYLCESFCLEKKLTSTELYYDHAMEIFSDVSNRFPNATIWLTGHSLGGAVASMVGQTFGIPTVTFESPGDRLASARLHLPHGPGAAKMPLWHFGHTADPIFVGVCTGPVSSCWYGGFAMETRCHTGKVCVWDTVNDNGWRVDIRSHRVQDVIENILKKPEEFPLPKCGVESECDDCGLWDFVDERDGPLTHTTTATQTSSAIPTPPDDPWQTETFFRV